MINFGDNDMLKMEPLNDALSGHIITTSTLGQMVHHPLVIMPLYSRDRCALINKCFEQKTEQLERAIHERDWHRYIMLYERPYRFDGLEAAIRNGLCDDPKDFWKIVGQVWCDSENIRENYAKWRTLWSSESMAQDRHACMSEEDRRAFSRLKSRIRIYRGIGARHYDTGGDGLSWSLSREKAIWFAHRFTDIPSRGWVRSAWVEKENVYAYFGARNESEIVVDPIHLIKPEYIDI